MEGDSFNTKHRKSTIISIHALRVEGDYRCGIIKCKDKKFLSTPSGWRATNGRRPPFTFFRRFLSTPSGWRATTVQEVRKALQAFLSTPSGWRATCPKSVFHICPAISIHALRVEGDLLVFTESHTRKNFYPRPPGGGRLAGAGSVVSKPGNFYPRPPGGGRPVTALHPTRTSEFLSTPSGWRATQGKRQRFNLLPISIHALRVEGDSHLSQIWP